MVECIYCEKEIDPKMERIIMTLESREIFSQKTIGHAHIKCYEKKTGFKIKKEWIRKA